ncbi:MAG: gamma-glutamylcyclotransferase [Marinovum sp.]|nr:gamma-glutamylcyclotransferase [Marinovum sp.]
MIDSRPLFLFGTLRDPNLLEIVAGERCETHPATLLGYDTRAVEGEVFPILVKDTGATADGFCLKDVSPEVMIRLDFYETLFDYMRIGVEIACDGALITADVYVPPEGRWQASDMAWDLDSWIINEGALSALAAQELLERRETTSEKTLRALLPSIRSRAHAKLLAKARPAPTLLRRKTDVGDMAVLKHGYSHDGFFRVAKFVSQAKRYDGAEGVQLSREAFVGFDAALLLPYDPATDLVMLIEQARFGALWRGDPEVFVLEPIAGLVDAGEDPVETARREAVEEAGLTLSEIRPIMAGYPAPGYVTEYHHCFLGLCDLSPDMAGIGGLVSESEDIRSHVIPFETAMALLRSGEINAVPLAMMLLWLAQQRDTLRQGI